MTTFVKAFTMDELNKRQECLHGEFLLELPRSISVNRVTCGEATAIGGNCNYLG